MRILLLIFFLSFSINLSAQKNIQHFNHVGVRNHLGFFLTNSQILDYVTHQHLRAYELFIEKKANGSKRWHREYNLPTVGMAFLMTDFNDKKFLGTAFSLYPYMKFNILNKEAVEVNFNAGVGVAYLTKRFHAENNRKNVAIGSKLNMSFSFLLAAEWQLLKNLSLNTGIALNHFSNTSFQKPNQGLNIPSCEIGLKYSFDEYEKADLKTKEEIPYGDWEFSAHAALAINEIYPANGEKYLAKTLSINFDKRSNYKSRIGSSLDLFYNPANLHILKNDSVYLDNHFENLQAGLSIHHTLMIGRFGLHTLAGYYIKTAYKEGGLLYQKIGGRYWINQSLVLNALLKTHFASAEYLEVGIGYYL